MGYTRLPADIPYGQQDRQGYSSVYVPTYANYPFYPYGYYPARTSYSYAPAVTHAYGNVDQSVGTPYMYTRLPADIPYGDRDRQGYSSVYAPAVTTYAYYPSYPRYSYSYAPAVTHAYGNVDQSVGPPYMYPRLPADIPYGERDRQGYSAYVPAVTSYDAVVNAIATPFMYRRAPYPVFYGHQARVGYTPNQPHYIHN